MRQSSVGLVTFLAVPWGDSMCVAVPGGDSTRLGWYAAVPRVTPLDGHDVSRHWGVTPRDCLDSSRCHRMTLRVWQDVPRCQGVTPWVSQGVTRLRGDSTRLENLTWLQGVTQRVWKYVPQRQEVTPRDWHNSSRHHGMIPWDFQLLSDC